MFNNQTNTMITEMSDQQRRMYNSLKSVRISRKNGTFCVLHDDEEEMHKAEKLKNEGILSKVRDNVVSTENKRVKYSLYTLSQ